MSGQMSHDFDFEFGTWTVQHRRLRERLAGCSNWEEFEGTSDTRPILGGSGNVEDNEVHLPGESYRAIAVRAFDAAAGTWAIWWLDGRHPHRLDVPVIGSFSAGIGQFFAEDTLAGRPIRIRFRWLDTQTAVPRWEQAFSPDAGLTWETNWTMRFHRR